MIKTKSISLGIVAIGILSILIVGTTPLTLLVNAQESEQKFIAELTGKEEVPPNESPSSGFAWVKTTNDEIRYKVNVTDMDKVNAAHIHLAEAGKNGPVALTLFMGGPTEQVNGTVGEANVTASNMEGPMKGKDVTDLVAAIKNGTMYVNVHTTDFPNGEIRGQLKDSKAAAIMSASANQMASELGKNVSEVGGEILNKTGEAAKNVVTGAADIVSNISGEIKEGISGNSSK
ncbi:MAG TPA: CHRD domain-containing protein [Nitrososphaeraceae archaeon]|nr:CHRD domain-containing protein [Nitrososphaeraceae archaeon]